MAIYHLTLKNGSRGGGQSASAKADYIAREGRYSPFLRDGNTVRKLQYDEVLSVINGNMPEWASANPKLFWKSADLYERANARLFREVEFSLPRELSFDHQRDLANIFAKSVTSEGLPFTMAIHAGGGTNPHVHLVFSERVNDGIARTPETFFKRANKADPEKGGAGKTRKNNSKNWLVQIREDWATTCNEYMRINGYDVTPIDHRSLVDQGYQKLATVHVGPWKDSEAALEAQRRNKEALESNNKLESMQAELMSVQDNIVSIESQITKMRIEKNANLLMDDYDSISDLDNHLKNLREQKPRQEAVLAASKRELNDAKAAKPTKEQIKLAWENFNASLLGVSNEKYDLDKAKAELADFLKGSPIRAKLGLSKTLKKGVALREKDFNTLIDKLFNKESFNKYEQQELKAHREKLSDIEAELRIDENLLIETNQSLQYIGEAETVLRQKLRDRAAAGGATTKKVVGLDVDFDELDTNEALNNPKDIDDDLDNDTGFNYE